MCYGAVNAAISAKFICVILNKESSGFVKHKVGVEFKKFGLGSLDSLFESLKTVAGSGSDFNVLRICQRKFKVTFSGSAVSLDNLAEFLDINEHVKRAYVPEEQAGGVPLIDPSID